MIRNIPILDPVDLCVLGGTASALDIAIRARKRGLTVLVLTHLSYFGEDRCMTLHLAGDENDIGLTYFPKWKGRVPSPMEVKRAWETRLIEGDIPFQYQTTAIGIVESKGGEAVGILIGNRGGLQVLPTKGVVDGTERMEIARQTAMPFRPFVPGPRTVRRVQFFPGGVRGVGEPLPFAQRTRGMQFNAFEASADLYLGGTNPSHINALEAQMRRLSWDPAASITADRSRFSFGDDATGADPEGFVLLTSQMGEGTWDELAAREKPGEPASVRGSHPAQTTLDLLFSKSPRFAGRPTCELDVASLPRWGSYDVAIVGGGTAGAAAGIGAAREGAATVILEHMPHLGGVGTEGRIASYWYGNRVGFTAEVDRAVANMGPGGDMGLREGHWNVEWKQQFWQEEAIRSGAEVWYEQMVVAVGREGNAVKTLLLSGPYGSGLIHVNTVVDATGSADVAAAAGAPTCFGDPREPACQGVGIPAAVPSAYYENSDYTFCDDTDPADRTRAFVSGRACHGREFDLGRLIDTRERRRIEGEFTIQPMDILLKRRYRDTINVARSNFDTHGFTVHPLFLIRPPDHDALEARVPYRALLPKGLENVLVAGLGMSAHRDAMPVIRMQPDFQNKGYAAGIAAAMAQVHQGRVRSISIRSLQEKLCGQGILSKDDLLDEEPTPPAFAEYPDALAAAFADPEGALPILRSHYGENPDLATAQVLAFLGDETGRAKLIQFAHDTPWDGGWHYTGMGQFGMCLSPLDTTIMALGKIPNGEAASVVLKHLSLLKHEHAFSHFRAAASFFIANPSPTAAPFFEGLLLHPGASGHAIQTLAHALAVHALNPTDTAERNRQLKEYYLAHALERCAPGNHVAKKSLAQYAQGLQGLYAAHSLRTNENPG